MRAYLPITPPDLQTFVADGVFRAAHALIVEPDLQSNSDTASDDQEELEFEVSWDAAIKSRELQDDTKALGFALAIDLEVGQIGNIQGNEVGLLSEISWSQVQSLLLSESEEPELSWFAPQEIPTYLPQWLA